MKRLLLLTCSALLLIILLASNQPHNNAVDLLEAYKIASTQARQWNESAKPYFISSVDDPAASKMIKGEDGKRNYWNFDFVLENTNKHLIITVHNKTIVSQVAVESDVKSEYIINMEELGISTSEAVVIAKEDYGLLPGADWAQGYHFVLENRGSLLILSVVGRNEDGVGSRVLFNAKTGEVIRIP